MVMLKIMLIPKSITGMQGQDRDLTELRLLHYSRGQPQMDVTRHHTRRKQPPLLLMQKSTSLRRRRRRKN